MLIKVRDVYLFCIPNPILIIPLRVNCFSSAGMKDGQKIVFHGEGDQEPDLEPGDVIIVLDQKDHGVFQRRGHDLITKMRIQLSEALCGFKKTIETLDNRVLVVSSRPGRSSEF